MGPIKQLLGLLPGVGSLLKDVNIEDKQLDRVEAQICSMTKEERRKPSSIDFPRRKRIAAGSGARQEEVGALVKQFDMVSKMTKQMAALTTNERVKAVKDMGDPASAMAALRSMPGLMGGRGSTHTASIKDRFKKRKK